MLQNPENLRRHFWSSLGRIAAGAILSPVLAVNAEVISNSAVPLFLTQSSSWQVMTAEEEDQSWNYQNPDSSGGVSNPQ